MKITIEDFKLILRRAATHIEVEPQYSCLAITNSEFQTHSPEELWLARRLWEVHLIENLGCSGKEIHSGLGHFRNKEIRQYRIDKLRELADNINQHQFNELYEGSYT